VQRRDDGGHIFPACGKNGLPGFPLIPWAGPACHSSRIPEKQRVKSLPFLQPRDSLQLAGQLRGRADTPGFTAGPRLKGSRWLRLAYCLFKEKHDEMLEARLLCGLRRFLRPNYSPSCLVNGKYSGQKMLPSMARTMTARHIPIHAPVIGHP
jgi:hypothetical protein